MTQIILGLGSNLGYRQENLAQAIKLIGSLLDNIIQSSIVESLPLLPDKSPAEWNIHYLNMVITGDLKDSNISPAEFLRRIKQFEVELGRQPSERWAPRVIDIDILAWGNEIVDLPDLKIPHAEMLKRDFVMKPLKEILPNWSPPVAENGKRKFFIMKKGIGRLAYFLVGTFLNIVCGVTFDYALDMDSMLSYLLTSLVLLPVVYLRMINIGWNPAMSLISMVPLADWFLEVPALAFQENYAATKKIDRTGKLIIWLPFIGAIAIGIGFALLVTLSTDVQGWLMKLTSDLIAKTPLAPLMLNNMPQ